MLIFTSPLTAKGQGKQKTRIYECLSKILPKFFIFEADFKQKTRIYERLSKILHKILIFEADFTQKTRIYECLSTILPKILIFEADFTQYWHWQTSLEYTDTQDWVRTQLQNTGNCPQTLLWNASPSTLELDEKLLCCAFLYSLTLYWRVDDSFNKSQNRLGRRGRWQNIIFWFGLLVNLAQHKFWHRPKICEISWNTGEEPGECLWGTGSNNHSHNLPMSNFSRQTELRIV